MRLPEKSNEISIDSTGWQNSPYPPLGFVAFYEAELGNGDCYGLYWPFGKENEEPIICEIYHDGWSINYRFSCLDKFLDWYSTYDDEDFSYDDEPEDSTNCIQVYMRGKEFLKSGDIDNAISYFRRATELFGEISEIWQSLAGQLKRTKDIDGFEKTVLRAIVSNWSFGIPSENTIRSFKAIRKEGPLKDDPLVKRSEQLCFSFGGTKENDEYNLISDCIDEYLSQNNHYFAIMLKLNYGYIMYSETTAFQERYNFSKDTWLSELKNMCKNGFGDSREFNYRV